jgi:Arm domain-containing DNA-binding protein
MLKQDRREKRLTGALLTRTLRGPPTSSAVHEGGGLYMDNRSPPREPGELRVGYWYYRYSAVEGGRRRNISISIGPTDEMSLADARARRDEIRRQIRAGVNPREQRKEEKQKREQKSQPPFSLAAIWDDYISTKKTAHLCKSAIDTYIRYWLRDVAPAIGDKDIREISRTDVVSVIRPHWQRSYGTLFRWFVWSLIDFATAEWEDKIAIGRNPAALGSIKTLPGPRSHKTKHRSALPWQDVPAYMARLRAVPDRKARAAEVTILEAKRSDEICAARCHSSVAALSCHRMSL